MTIEEYKENLGKLKIKHEEEIAKLQEEYALSNNPYKIGDIIEDHIGRIEIERIEIEYGYFSKAPSCRYYGHELRKSDNTRKKNGSKRWSYQCNVTKKIERV